MKQGIMKGSVVLVMCLLQASAFAFGESPVSGGLSWVLDELMGTTGVALASLGLGGMGLLCVYGYLEFTRLLQTAAGIALLFGAKTIVTAIRAAAGA